MTFENIEYNGNLKYDLDLLYKEHFKDRKKLKEIRDTIGNSNLEKISSNIFSLYKSGSLNWSIIKVRKFIRAYNLLKKSNHREELAKEKGFNSHYEYQTFNEEKAKDKPLNKYVSNLINTKLKEIGKKRFWLVKQIDRPKITIYSYCYGTLLPRKLEVIEKICSVLGIDEETKQTLENLLLRK